MRARRLGLLALAYCCAGSPGIAATLTAGDTKLDDVGRMTALQIPFTAWFVDRPYSDGANAWSAMNFAPAFEDPDLWIGQIRRDYGLEFMTWVSPATFGDTRFPRHLAGRYTYLDLSDPDTVAVYEDTLQLEQYAYGVKGHKIDRADESFPVDEPWLDENISPAERRNRYAYLLQKTQDEALRAAWGPDQFTFARAAIHRTQPYLSALWGGDPRSTWDGLSGNFANVARAAFLGFPVWGTDSGGYLGEGRIPEELYVRWLEGASMTGLFEIKLDGAGGSGEDRLPWHYGEALQRRFRAICEERMRMIPYLYSLARTSAVNGTLMQPLDYRHFDDPKRYDIWDEFYVGDAILVAPVLLPGDSRPVYLPKGEWRDFDRPAKRYTGGKTYDIAAPLDKLPRFVKENSLFVSGNVYQRNDRRWSNADPSLVIDAYPGHGASSTELTYFDLNDDDNAKTIRLERNGRSVSLSAPAMVVDTQVHIVLDVAPDSVTLDGKDVVSNYDADAKTLSLLVPAGQAIELVVGPRVRSGVEIAAISRHCEERSDEAIQAIDHEANGLLRFARNDGIGSVATARSASCSTAAPGMRPFGQDSLLSEHLGDMYPKNHTTGTVHWARSTHTQPATFTGEDCQGPKRRKDSTCYNLIGSRAMT